MSSILAFEVRFIDPVHVIVLGDGSTVFLGVGRRNFMSFLGIKTLRDARKIEESRVLEEGMVVADRETKQGLWCALLMWVAL